jgi:hypothetical protein
MASQVKKFREIVSAWPHISTHPHRFAAWEFLFGKAEVGHVHLGGTLDIPFTRAIRDVLLEEHLAEEHRWVPDSGWTTFRIRDDDGLGRALWLMRLSYLRYAMKIEPNPNPFFQAEVAQLHLDSRLASLMAKFLPATVRD